MLKKNIRILLVMSLFLYTHISYANITKGPYLNIPKQSSIVIMWESDHSEQALLKYGKTKKVKHILKTAPMDSSNNLFLYQMKISDLDNGHKYFYQVIMSDTVSELSYFKTAPAKDTAIKLVAVGDSRTGHEVHRKISETINELSPDLIISMGDLVGDGGNFEEWGPHYFQPAADIINHIPLVSTLGDHDTNIDNGKNFNYYFRYNKTHEQVWFSYDYGPAHFVSLDYRAEYDSSMITWFEQDMQQTDANWKFVYLHRPSYNLGGHRTNWGAGVYPDLYRKYQVDIVFTGHSHLYERFYPMRPSKEKNSWPVTYITTGGAGAGLYEAIDHEFTAFTKSINHFITIKLTENSLEFKALLPDKTLLDEFKINKKDGLYDSSYLSLIKPQEVMDVHMIFAKKLLIRFNQKPSTTAPAIKEIKFESINVDEDIKFKVYLAKESAHHYKIEPLEGVLKKGQTYEGFVKLYAKQDYKMDGRYFVPPVLLNASYKTSFAKGEAIGRQSRYYEPE